MGWSVFKIISKLNNQFPVQNFIDHVWFKRYLLRKVMTYTYKDSLTPVSLEDLNESIGLVEFISSALYEIQPIFNTTKDMITLSCEKR